jgi:undecaprenyl-diphosphatase
MDDAVTQWINASAGSNIVLDTMMVALTQYGVPLLVLFVILQWWSTRERPHVRHTCITAGLSFLVGLGFNQLILLFVHRVRPYDAGVSHLIISRSSDWSFPSDHATATVAIATAFLLHGFGWRGFAFLGGAFLIGLSRIYVGTHYLTDVLGGFVTGVIAAAAVSGLYWEGTRLDRLVSNIL